MIVVIVRPYCWVYLPTTALLSLFLFLFLSLPSREVVLAVAVVVTILFEVVSKSILVHSYPVDFQNLPVSLKGGGVYSFFTTPRASHSHVHQQMKTLIKRPLCKRKIIGSGVFVIDQIVNGEFDAVRGPHHIVDVPIVEIVVGQMDS